MNNLVFNTVASELKSAIYGLAPDLSTQPIRVDGSGQLLVAGSLTISDDITVSAIIAPVTIGNTSLTVAGEVEITNTSVTVTGTVAVSEITSPVTIGNASLTVSGEVEITNTSVTVAGTVAVSEITAPVTIGNTSLTVAGDVTISNAAITVTGGIAVTANAFYDDSVVEETITGTGVLLNHTDISTLKVASFFVYNEGTTPITLSLQISPEPDDSRYLDDPNYTDVVIEEGEGQYISVSLFAHYARLQYNMGAEEGVITAYFNGQA